MARQRVEEIREQTTALTSRLQDEQDRLSRLTITRETVEEILGEAARLADEPEEQAEVADTAGTVDAAPPWPPVLGVVTVPPWQPGMNAAVLPCAYWDAIEIMADAGRAIRAGQITVVMGLGMRPSRGKGCARN